ALPVDRSKTEPRSAYYKLQFGDEETGFSYYVQTTTVVIGRNCDRAAPPPAITSTPIPNIPPLEEEPLFPPPPSALDVFSPSQPPHTFDTPELEGINGVGVSPSGLASADVKLQSPNDHPADSATAETHDLTPHPSDEAVDPDLVNPQLLEEPDVKPQVVPDEAGLVSEESVVHGADSGNGSEPERIKSEEIQLDSFDFDALGAPPPPPAKSSAPVEHVDVDLGPLKSVSRNHAKISFVPDLGHFCLELMGRNGAWVNGAYFVKGATVPLTQGAQIQISTRIFSFILPPSPGGSPSYQSYALGDSPYEVEDLPYPYNLPAQDVRYNDFYGEGGPGPATAATMAARVPATFNAFAAGNGYGLGISGVGDGKWLQQWDSDEDSSENSDDSEEGSLEGEYEDDEDEEEDDEAEETLVRPKIKIRARPKGADEQSELSSAPGDPTEDLDSRGKKSGQGRRQSTAASVQDVDGDSRQKVGGKRPTKQTGKHPTKKGSKTITEEDSGTMSATDDAQNGSAKTRKTKGINGDSPPKKESKKKAKAVAAVTAALDEVVSEIPAPAVATLAAALAAAPPSPPKPAVARPLPPSAASAAVVRPPPGQPLPNGARPQQPLPLTAVRPPPHAVSPAVRSSPSTTPAPEIQRPFYVTELKETPGRPGHLIVEVPIPPSGSGPRPAPGPPIGLDGNPFIGPLQQKPNLTFANIIHRALVYLPRGRGTLGEVCNWIAGEWEWFRMNVDGGWQNSIRHNLSLNKAFLKVPRIPEDDPEYKGSVWILDPEEGPAFEEKQRRDAEKGQGKVKTAEPKRAKEPIRIDDRIKKPAEIHLADMSRPTIQQQRAQPPAVRPIARPNPAPAATPVPGRGVNAKGALQPKTKVAVVVQSITPAMRAKSVIATTDADGKPLPFVCDGTTLVLETGTFGHLTKDILDKLTLLGAASAVDVLSAWVDNKNKTKSAPKPSQGTASTTTTTTTSATTTTTNGATGAVGSKPIVAGGQGQAVRPPATQPLAPRPLHPTINKPTSTVPPAPPLPATGAVIRPTTTTTITTSTALPAKPPMQRNLPGPAPPGATLTKVISMIAEVANAKGDVNTVGPHASALLMYIRKVGVDIDLRVAERIWATGKVPNPLPERKKPSPSPPTPGLVKSLPPVPTSIGAGGQNQIKSGPTTSNGLKRKLDDAGPQNEDLKKPKLEAGGA
ncbi:hypothetical protein BCR39DRAFT_506272, partial [Naematelia encephala]